MIKDNRLSEREESVLRSIIRLFIFHANPVGSRVLAKYLEPVMNLSPATIRNVMADLEEMDFISQPHTSAGRVPTDKGYRYFVNSLQNLENLSDSEQFTIKSNLVGLAEDDILKDASKILSMLSHYLGVVQIPDFKNILVTKIELIQLSSNRILIILALDSNFVRTVNLEAAFEISPAQLQMVASYINEKISGKPLSFIRENFKELIENISELNKPLFRLFINSSDKIFDSRIQEDKLLISGASQILSEPGFEELSKVKSVVEIIENQEVLIHLLDQTESVPDGMKIMIGSEMGSQVLNDYSMIVTSYRFGAASGSIGVIGPKHMNYARMMSIVDYVAKTINKI